MVLSLIITYKLAFSNQIVDYFKSLNPINNFYYNFWPIGLDEMNEDMLLKTISDRIDNNNKIEIVVVFADIGLPMKLAKRIKIKNRNVKLIISKGSLIENGYLSYMLLNTKAPIESVELVVDKHLNKG